MTALLAVGSGWLAAAWTSPAPRPAPAEKPAAAITAGDDPVNVEIERIGKDPGTGGNAARLAALATRFREAPLSQLSELRSMLDSWRPGTEKEVARAVIDSR
ncbi:MAG TPA: hypothetical protein VHM91_13515, partial [Verrucomicrobiales bacterium]|nr:hypothetical protein [Verrucomicrobiales bacterium]